MFCHHGIWAMNRGAGSGLFLGLVLAFGMLLAACGGKDQGEGYIPEAPIEVTFGTNPATPHPAGQPLTLYVQVTQEGQPVEDADEVQFEIWSEEASHEADGHDSAEGGHPGGHGAHMDGYQSDHPFYDAVHVGNGVYELTHTFDEPGTYYVMYHVTARGYHDMVKYEVEITE